MSHFIATKYLPKKINVIEIRKGPVGLGHNSRAIISTQTLHKSQIFLPFVNSVNGCNTL